MLFLDQEVDFISKSLKFQICVHYGGFLLSFILICTSNHACESTENFLQQKQSSTRKSEQLLIIKLLLQHIIKASCWRCSSRLIYETLWPLWCCCCHICQLLDCLPLYGQYIGKDGLHWAKLLWAGCYTSLLLFLRVRKISSRKDLLTFSFIYCFFN